MLVIKFDKRLELIYGLLFCTKIDRNTEITFVSDMYPNYDKKFYEMYKTGISKEFSDYIVNGGLDTYNRCIDIANAISENYDVVANKSIRIIEKNNKNFNALKLSNYLKEFVEKSKFEDFYDSTSDLRNNLIDKFRNALNYYVEFNPNIIEKFYGYSIGPMEIILLNFSRGSYGQEYDNKIAYIAGLVSYNNGEFEKYTISTLFHEFSHPYINPLGIKYFSGKRLNNLFNNSLNNGLDDCYLDLVTLINEYVVRAVQIILSSKYFEEDKIIRIIERQKSFGYTFIEDLIKVFNKKDNFDSFEEFYKKEIVTFFLNLEEKLKEKNVISK